MNFFRLDLINPMHPKNYGSDSCRGFCLNWDLWDYWELWELNHCIF